MTSKELARFVSRRFIELCVISLLIIFLPNLPPFASISKPYSLVPTRPFEGSLKLNDKLNDVEIWHKGNIHGPEAFIEYKGVLYTGLHSGGIAKLVGEHIVPVVTFGKPCSGAAHEEHLCGRPLGLAINEKGDLFVADCYYGLFKYNIEKDQKELLVGVGEVIDGIKVKLPNSVVLASNGDLYWTDSSTQFGLQDGILDMLADGSGRLIHYDAKSKKSTVLIQNLHFANGVALSDDESFIIVGETVGNRIHRYYLKGPKKGTSDIFIDGLPGLVDNLKSDGKGGFLVPLVVAVDDENPQYLQNIGPYPLFRKLLARIIGLSQYGFQITDNLYPNEFSKKAVHFIGHFTMGSFMYPKRVTVLHVSKEGTILDSLHTTSGKIAAISEAHIYRDSLYLGSPFNDYIARIPLAKIGWQHLAATRAPEKPKPQVTTTASKPKREAQPQPVKDQPKAVPVTGKN